MNSEVENLHQQNGPCFRNTGRCEQMRRSSHVCWTLSQLCCCVLTLRCHSARDAVPIQTSGGLEARGTAVGMCMGCWEVQRNTCCKHVSEVWKTHSVGLLTNCDLGTFSRNGACKSRSYYIAKIGHKLVQWHKNKRLTYIFKNPQSKTKKDK